MNTSTTPFQPDHAWWRALLDVIDAADAEGFAAYFTPDGVFRFGNAPPIVGVDAIREGVAGFFKTIKASRHELLKIWNAPGSTVGEGQVTYTRLDGGVVSVPFVDVFELQGGKISVYKIFIDQTPVYAD